MKFVKEDVVWRAMFGDFRRFRGGVDRALTAIRLAIVWGSLKEDDVAPLLAKRNHLVAILVRLTR